MRRQRVIMFVGCLAILMAGAWVFAGRLTERIDSYAQCVGEGYPVTESNPPTCRAGRHTFTGPTTTPAPSAEATITIPFEIMVDGDSRSDYPAEQKVITTAADWAGFWASVHRAVTPRPPILPADFTKQNIVALSAGQKPTGGYDLKVTSIAGNSHGTTVNVTATVPGAGCQVTQALSNPYFIVSTDPLTEPVSFRITTETHNCKN